MTGATAAIDALVLVPAGTGVCCAAGGSRPGRIPVTVASAVMLFAMLDTGIGPGVIAPVLWAAVLMLAGLGLALWARATPARRTTPPRAPRAAAGASLAGAHHTAIGLVLTAVLVLAMHGGATSSQSSETMTMTPGRFTAFLLLGTIVFCIASAVLIVRERSTPRRIESAAMAASVAMMAVPLLL